MLTRGRWTHSEAGREGEGHGESKWGDTGKNQAEGGREGKTEGSTPFENERGDSRTHLMTMLLLLSSSTRKPSAAALASGARAWKGLVRRLLQTSASKPRASRNMRRPSDTLLRFSSRSTSFSPRIFTDCADAKATNQMPGMATQPINSKEY